MSASIGKQLKQARLKRGLTVEDIAHETRIQQDKLRSLEEDDYSPFPSPTYAKSFLTIYSEYLDVDASEVIEAMAGPKGGGLGGSQTSLQPAIDLTPSDQTIPIFKGNEEPKQGHPILMVLLFLMLVVTIPGVYLIGKRMAHEEISAQAALTEPPIAPEAVSPPDSENTPPAKPDKPAAGADNRSESEILNDLIWTPGTAADGDVRVTPASAPPTEGNETPPVATPIDLDSQPEDPPTEDVPSTSGEPNP